MKHLLLYPSCAFACLHPRPSQEQPDRNTYQQLAAQADTALHSEILNVWFPRSVDNVHGGFHSHFAQRLERTSQRRQVLRLPGTHDVGRRTSGAPRTGHERTVRPHRSSWRRLPVERDVGQAGRRLLLGTGRRRQNHSRVRRQQDCTALDSASTGRCRLSGHRRSEGSRTRERRFPLGSISTRTIKPTAATTSGLRATARPSFRTSPTATSRPMPSAPSATSR